MINPILGVFGLRGGDLLLVFFGVLIFGGLLIAALAVAAYFVIRSLNKEAPVPPPVIAKEANPTVPCGKQVAEHANLAGFRFHDVSLAGADFDNVNLTNARFHNVNLSNVSVTAAQMGGAVFKHVGPPPDKDGKQERQRPVRFEEMMLCDSTFRKVDLSNVRVTDCDLSGMTINGFLATDLITAYQKQQTTSQGGAS
jgi:Pentapeptide repeats (9 copies)